MSDYVLHPVLSKASLSDYLRLFMDAFGADEKFTPEYLTWQYTANPHGRVIGFDAYLGEELAAHYVVIPRRYRSGCHDMLAALSLNTATHPAHQGKGLFVKLATATYEAAANLGVKFVVGAANANSVGGFTKRLGFQSRGQIRLQLALRAPSSREPALDLSLDEEWLTWRFANPSRRYVEARHSDGSSTVRTWVRNVPFNLCRVPTGHLSATHVGSRVQRGLTVLPALTPVFGPGSDGAGFRLPLRMQPSPWHVIWRSLSSDADEDLAGRLRFGGLSMDTF